MNDLFSYSERSGFSLLNEMLLIPKGQKISKYEPDKNW